MGRILNTSTQLIKEKVGLEGRPVSLTVSLESDGSALSGPPYSSISVGEVGIDVGKAVLVSSISISSSFRGRVSGVIAQNALNDWIGSSNQDSFDIALDGGFASLDFDGLILGSGSRVSLTFTPYPEAGQTKPDLGLRINGLEFTADYNFSAAKKLLYCGDSISWSLLGNWKTQDLGYNYSGNRREDSLPFPSYFGDLLASFRLVQALRQKTKPEDIRLVNKGFGGSKLSSDQWFSMRSGLYSLPWNLMVMQAGVNDATDIQTPLRQLTMGQRIQDMVSKRNEDGRGAYPMVFCTPPICDDKYEGTDARVCLDVRPPLNTESRTDFDSGAVSTIDLSTVNSDKWCNILGDGSNLLNITGGEDGEVFRIDFTTEATILTGTANGTNSNAFVRTLESQLNRDDSPIQNDGEVTIPAGTSLFLRCISQNEEYEELDRVSIVGSVLAPNASQFDTQDATVNHFICDVNTSPTQITGPTIAGASLSYSLRNALPSRNITQLTIQPGNRPSADLFPSESAIANNDVWVRITGMQNDAVTPGALSWSGVNGFYKVTGINISGGDIASFEILLDTRDGANREFFGSDGDNSNYVQDSGTIEIFVTRPYIAQFEGNANSNESNCSFFANGDNTVGDYTVKVQLQEGTASPFNLVAGKGIALSVYQQGNVIYMNEVASGDITNSGKIIGADSKALFNSQTETGLTRLKTVRKVITDTVNAYQDSDKVHLVELYNIDDLRLTTETASGRLIYGEANYKADTSAGADTTLLINDLIEDPIFKGTGDTGTNERVMGKRLHRSPKGHEELFNRLWSVVENLTIPS